MTDANTNPPTASDPMWREECARRILLDHLGITPLISRFDPIAAKPAERLMAPTADGQVTSLGAAPEAIGEMQGEQLRALLRGEAGERETGEKASVEKQTEERDRISAGDASQAQVGERAAEVPNDVETGVLSGTSVAMLMVTSQDILWVEVLEDQLLRTEQLQLIAAMARAVRGNTVRCAHQQFSWPPVGESAKNVAGGFGDMLSGFLQRLVRDHAIQHVVQLGECGALPNTEVQIHRIHSSLEMLRDGSLKQSAWSVLKQLRSGG